MKKKVVVVAIIIFIIILISIAIYLFYKGGKPKDEKNVVVPKDDGNTIPPVIGPGGTAGETYRPCTSDAFPLGRGSKNTCVIALQQALGISQDGNFGPKTQSAVETRGYVVPLSYSDFNKILFGNTSPAPIGGWKAGDDVYLKGMGREVSIYEKKNSLGITKIGYIKNIFTASQKIGKFQSSAFFPGYATIILNKPIDGKTNVIVSSGDISKIA